MDVQFGAIPAELRELPRWLVWRLETRDGKPTKVPYQATRPSVGASSTDAATWAPLEEALSAAESGRFDGIGFALGDGYIGVDLDRVLDEAGAFAEDFPLADIGTWIAALNSYTEHSPSGRGLHVIGRGEIPEWSGNRAGPVEVYGAGRYFTVTGDVFEGLAAVRDFRELPAFLDAAGLRKTAPSANGAGPAVPVDLDDRELLDRAMRAANGADFARLWNGDTSGYPSRSEADLALCTRLAFWTGRDEARIARLFRASGLMREKWERHDYRERTIQVAISTAAGVYEPSKSKVRPTWDALGTHPASDPAAGEKSAGASRVPACKGTQGRDAPTQPPIEPEERGASRAQQQALQAEEAEAFAAVEEASAEPLLGDDENTVLAAGGAAVYYGDGGAGKTTLGLDRACHYCAGRVWLGLQVSRPLRVLWIENEGPRGKFRKKVRAKLKAWDGPPLEGRLHVLTRPWARFTFADNQMRVELVELVRELGVDVVIAGPVARLGAEGGGTPKEIQAFIDLLELVRADLGRPLAYELIHHENKAGGVSGAWEGATDTLVHVQARGNGHTAIVWRKARWAPEIHGKTWKLDWQPGEQFEVDATPETTDDDIAETLLGLVRESPGRSWNAYDEKLGGKASRKRAVRDDLLEDGQLLNLGTPKAMRLYLPEQATLEPLP